jgi:hypothetical protein
VDEKIPGKIVELWWRPALRMKLVEDHSVE